MDVSHRSQVKGEAKMRLKFYAAVVLILLMTAGCSHYGALTNDYGNSYNMAKSSQILNRRASKNQNPVMGLSGTVADVTLKNYAQSFVPAGQGQQQAPSAVLMSPISVGAGKDVYGK
jgi:hypothetical protein